MRSTRLVGDSDAVCVSSNGDETRHIYSPARSPDSKKIAYSDKKLRLWYVDTDKRQQPVLVDTSEYNAQLALPHVRNPSGRRVG